MKITLFRQINSATGSLGSLNFRIEIFDNCRMPTIGIDKAGAGRQQNMSGTLTFVSAR